MAPNTPLAAITTEASPPGSQPSHLSSAAKRRFTAPLPENTAPMKMKSGMASSVNELSDSHAVHAICTSGLSTANTRPTRGDQAHGDADLEAGGEQQEQPAHQQGGDELRAHANTPRRRTGPPAGRPCRSAMALASCASSTSDEQREPDRQRHLRPLERGHQQRVRPHVAGERIGEELPAHPRGDSDEHESQREGDEAHPAGGARAAGARR